MQSQNNFQRRKLAQMIVISLLAAVAVALMFIWLGRPEQGGRNQAGEYYDPLSKQTVSDPPDKGPDVFNSYSNLPVYLGFDALIDQGMTLEQLSTLKLAFYNYSQTLPKPIKEISLAVDSIDTEREGSIWYISFPVRFNRQTDYQAKVDYTDLDTIRLYLSDNDGQVLFDSQNSGSEVVE